MEAPPASGPRRFLSPAVAGAQTVVWREPFLWASKARVGSVPAGRPREPGARRRALSSSPARRRSRSVDAVVRRLSAIAELASPHSKAGGARTVEPGQHSPGREAEILQEPRRSDSPMDESRELPPPRPAVAAAAAPSRIFLDLWSPALLRGNKLVVEGTKLEATTGAPVEGRWRSGAVVARRGARTVVTRTGTEYVLEGRLFPGGDLPVPQFIVLNFAAGFPERWEELAANWAAWAARQQDSTLPNTTGVFSAEVSGFLTCPNPHCGTVMRLPAPETRGVRERLARIEEEGEDQGAVAGCPVEDAEDVQVAEQEEPPALGDGSFPPDCIVVTNKGKVNASFFCRICNKKFQGGRPNDIKRHLGTLRHAKFLSSIGKQGKEKDSGSSKDGRLMSQRERISSNVKQIERPDKQKSPDKQEERRDKQKRPDKQKERPDKQERRGKQDRRDQQEERRDEQDQADEQVGRRDQQEERRDEQERPNKQRVMSMKKKRKQTEMLEKPTEGSMKQGLDVSRYGRKRKLDEMAWRRTVVESPPKRGK